VKPVAWIKPQELQEIDKQGFGLVYKSFSNDSIALYMHPKLELDSKTLHNLIHKCFVKEQATDKVYYAKIVNFSKLLLSQANKNKAKTVKDFHKKELI
jgi:hypothetical protein